MSTVTKAEMLLMVERFVELCAESGFDVALALLPEMGAEAWDYNPELQSTVVKIGWMVAIGRRDTPTPHTISVDIGARIANAADPLVAMRLQAGLYDSWARALRAKAAQEQAKRMLAQRKVNGR